MGTDVAILPGGALNEAAVKKALDVAVENRAIDELFTAAVRADAQRLYEEGRGLRDAAQRLSALVVECNAAIGEVDLLEHPSLKTRRGSYREGVPPLILGGKPLIPSRRRAFRALGVSRQRGYLRDRIAESRDDGEITTHGVKRAIYRRGDGYVSVEEVRKAITGTGMSARAALRAAGYSQSDLRSNRSLTRTTWAKAQRIAAAAGFDARLLGPAPPSPVVRTRVPGWLKRERRRTGGRWDEAYSRHRLLLDEVQRLAPANETRYDRLYEHLYAVEDFLGKRLREGA